MSSADLFVSINSGLLLICYCLLPSRAHPVGICRQEHVEQEEVETERDRPLHDEQIMEYMQNVYPTLRITDYEVATASYVDTLGFRIGWEYRFEPGFPVFMHISRHGLALYLSQHRGAGLSGGLVYLDVPDVDTWYREFCAKCVSISHPPEDQPWGTRAMVVTDPDGNRLNISTRLSPGAAPL